MLWAISADDDLMMFFLFLLENKIWHFMQIVSYPKMTVCINVKKERERERETERDREREREMLTAAGPIEVQLVLSFALVSYHHWAICFVSLQSYDYSRFTAMFHKWYRGPYTDRTHICNFELHQKPGSEVRAKLQLCNTCLTLSLP